MGATTLVFAHIYSALGQIRRAAEMGNRPEMEKLRDSLEQLRESVEEKLDQVRKETETDRRLASADRTTIAERMVTRSELDRQIDRVLAELDKVRSGRP